MNMRIKLMLASLLVLGTMSAVSAQTTGNCNPYNERWPTCLNDPGVPPPSAPLPTPNPQGNPNPSDTTPSPRYNPYDPTTMPTPDLPWQSRPPILTPPPDPTVVPTSTVLDGFPYPVEDFKMACRMAWNISEVKFGDDESRKGWIVLQNLDAFPTTALVQFTFEGGLTIYKPINLNGNERTSISLHGNADLGFNVPLTTTQFFSVSAYFPRAGRAHAVLRRESNSSVGQITIDSAFLPQSQ